MADAPDNLVLQMLRKIDTKLDRVAEDVWDIKACMDRIGRRLELSDGPYGGVHE